MQRGRKSSAALAIEPLVVRQEPAIKPCEPSSKPPEPPRHLGRPERRLCRDIFAEYEISGAAASAVLCTGLEAHARAREAREAIQAAGMTLIGRDGQPKPHPLLATERDARQAFLAAIKTLGVKL